MSNKTIFDHHTWEKKKNKLSLAIRNGTIFIYCYDIDRKQLSDQAKND